MGMAVSVMMGPKVAGHSSPALASVLPSSFPASATAAFSPCSPSVTAEGGAFSSTAAPAGLINPEANQHKHINVNQMNQILANRISFDPFSF
jgi:hypothetical protein